MHGTFTPAESEAKLATALIDRHRKFLEESYPTWGKNQARSLAHQRENGALSTWLWRADARDAVGLLWIEAGAPTLKIHGVWLEPGGPRYLSEVLEDVAEDRGTPVGAITDVLPDLPGADEFFGSRGFWHRSKVLMRHPTGTVPGGGTPHPQIRRIAVDDLKEIVGVYVRAYSDRPGEFWTWTSADPRGMADADVMGHVGPDGSWLSSFRADASYVWVEDRRIVGAILVEEKPPANPYVEDLIVEPEYHRRGIGRALLDRSVSELARAGPRPIDLAAIRFGAPYRLYRTLGFVELPQPGGLLDGHWIRGPSPY